MRFRLTTHPNEDFVEGDEITVTWTLTYSVEDIRLSYGETMTDAEVIAKVKELAVADFRNEESLFATDLLITDESESEISTFY